MVWVFGGGGEVIYRLEPELPVMVRGAVAMPDQCVYPSQTGFLQSSSLPIMRIAQCFKIYGKSIGV